MSRTASEDLIAPTPQVIQVARACVSSELIGQKAFSASGVDVQVDFVCVVGRFALLRDAHRVCVVLGITRPGARHLFARPGVAEPLRDETECGRFSEPPPVH